MTCVVKSKWLRFCFAWRWNLANYVDRFFIMNVDFRNGDWVMLCNNTSWLTTDDLLLSLMSGLQGIKNLESGGSQGFLITTYFWKVLLIQYPICLVFKKIFLAVEHGALAVKKFSVTGFLTIDDLSTKNIYIDGSGVDDHERTFDKRRLSLSKNGRSECSWNDHIFDEVK